MSTSLSSSSLRQTLRTSGRPLTAPRVGAWVAIADGATAALVPGVARTVGAGPEADLQIRCSHVSGIHCQLRARGHDVWVEDMDSTNGVWLEGVRVPSGKVGRDATVRIGRRAVLLARQVGWQVPDTLLWQGMIGRDPKTLKLWGQLAAAADSDAPVWVHGETGTGKELAARALHTTNPRRCRGPFVALNCAALPAELAEAELFGVTRGAFTGANRDRSGAFVRADGGTLLLDEIGELPATVQAKLLRVLETGEVRAVGAERPQRVDVRVVASTWRDLEEAANAGRFRDDLLHRLWVLKISIPPLRSRLADVASLFDHLLVEAGGPHLFPDRTTLAVLEGATWPGNVRQLRNHVRRAVTADDAGQLVPEGPARVAARRALRLGTSLGRRVLVDAIEDVGGNRAAAARALGVSRSTLYRWLERGD
ncbi:MAG: FHA domain-containing protein [Deltaproteobacteria bacterium]|nr:MAG: FHA domain-containing protein [Deltaproteobacteria bacterium]